MSALRVRCPYCGKQIKIPVSLKATITPDELSSTILVDASPNLDRVWKHYEKHAMGGES